jgi:hypothetical protein
MEETIMRSKIQPVSDQALLQSVRQHVQAGLTSLVELLRCLQQVEVRSLHLSQGFSSLFAYCCSLGFSEGESWRRVAAARLLLRCPEALCALQSGTVHLTGISMLYTFAKKNPQADVKALLREMERKGKKEIDVLLAKHSAAKSAPRRPTLKPVARYKAGSNTDVDRPVEKKSTSEFAAPIFPPTASDTRPIDSGNKAELSSSLERPKAGLQQNLKQHSQREAPPESTSGTASIPFTLVSDPIPPAQSSSEVVFELRATLDASAKADLDAIQNLLRHRIPAGDLNDVLKLVLREAAERLRAKKACTLRLKRESDKPPKTKAPIGATIHPTAVSRGEGTIATVETVTTVGTNRTEESTDPSPARGRAIPRAIRRAVFQRDQGKCTWKGANGQGCRATAFLEYHHREAFALGGAHSTDNIALLCRAHNQLEGVQIFGEAACRARPRERCSPRPLTSAKRPSLHADQLETTSGR